MTWPSTFFLSSVLRTSNMKGRFIPRFIKSEICSRRKWRFALLIASIFHPSSRPSHASLFLISFSQSSTYSELDICSYIFRYWKMFSPLVFPPFFWIFSTTIYYISYLFLCYYNQYLYHNYIKYSFIQTK